MSFSDADILDRLYAAPFDSDALVDTLRMIGRRVGAASLNMRLMNARTQETVIYVADGPFHTDPANLKAYAEHWARLDTHIKAGLAAGADGRILIGAELIDPASARRDPYLNEFYWPCGVGPIVGWATASGPQVTVFGACRARDQAEFGEDEVRELRRFQSHIDRALRLADNASSGRLSRDEVALAQRREHTALMRCASDGRILIASPGSAEVIAIGGAARLSRDRLVWRDPGMEALFAQVCRAAVDRDSRGIMQFVVREVGGAVLRIAAAPGPEGGTALVTFRRLRAPGLIDPAILQASFGLSLAESRVAIAVAEGRSLPEIASAHGVKHATVRTQLRVAFAKLGVGRQSELAGLLARLA